jgi:glycosyltransferase involved in cell wall biosynthesis
LNLLFIAYHFPPIGGAGAQRSAKFVRYLPDFGVNPIVIGGPSASEGRWEPKDATQVAELPDNVPVYRPSTPAPVSEAESRWRRLMPSVTEQGKWWQHQIRELGDRAASEHHLDAIYASLLPYESLAAALDLGRSLRLPVIADLRDPWALDEVRLYPTRAHRSREQRIMGQLLGECALVIGNTPEATAAIGDVFPFLGGDKLVTITNGYDTSDFANVESRPADGKFRIVHTGYLHTSLGMAQRRNHTVKAVLGGSLWPIDLLCRSHFYLLRAVSLLKTKDPELASRIDIVLAGVLSDEDERIIRESPAADQVRTLGYVDHRAAIREMMHADVLFLPMHSVPNEHRARIVPGKTYEYLASGKPILAAVPPGDAQDFIADAGAGIVADPSDADMIARSIQMLAEGPARTRQIGEGVGQFERRQLTQRLAEHLIAL